MPPVFRFPLNPSSVHQLEENSMAAKEIAGLISLAYLRIKSHLIATSLFEDKYTNLWLKCENQQQTGSFKWRGALAKLSLISAPQAIVTASTGNHGLGVANAAALYHLNARIYIPATTSPKKISMLKSLGADLQLVEGDSLSAELAGKAYAADHHLPWVSPYNDIDVISGQGTIGLEITEKLKEIDRIYITVGGGGLISGIASWMKTYSPKTEIIGCQPANSPEMSLSVKTGRVVTDPEAKPTLSDGSAGPLEEDSITFGICQKLIDRFILVEEEEIENAIRYVWASHQMVIEGAAGVAIAAAQKDKGRATKDRSVVVLCGGNIDEGIHQRICQL